MSRIKIKKKSEIEQRENDERRAEIRMLEVYVSRYPKQAKEFLERQAKNLIDNKICLR